MARKGGKKETASEPAWSEGLERRGFWVAGLVIAVLLVAFFNPVFFAGKDFQDADNIASMAHKPFVEEAFSSEGSIMDRYPLWTPYIFSGMPSWLIAAPYTSLRSILMAPIAGIFKVVAYYFILGLFTWLYLRRRGMSVFAALLGSVAYLFATHIVTHVMFGHNSKVATLMFMPLVLLATEEVWEKGSLLWASILALAIGLLIGGTHFQIAYYTLLAGGLYLLVVTVDAARTREWIRVIRGWALWLGALVVGIGTAAVVYLPTREYAEHSIRGGEGGGLTYDYATNWSFHPLEITTFFSPSFMGFGTSSYWGWMPFTHFPHYMGILVLLLAVLAVALWPRDRTHIYLVLLAGLSLLLSFGKHVPFFYNAMFEYFPYFSKFRVPSMILVLFQFAVAMLAAMGLHRMFSSSPEDRPRITRHILVVGGVFLGIVLLLGGMVATGGMDGTLTDRLSERSAGFGLQGEQQRQFASRYAEQVRGMVERDTLAVALILVLGIGLLWWRQKGKVSGTLATLGLLILVTADLWNIGHRPATYYPRANAEASFQATGAVRFIQNDPEYLRILPLTGAGRNNNLYAYFKISSILGYHPAKLKIYQDLIDEAGPVGISKTLSQGNFNVASMLNMKYVLADQEVSGPSMQTVFRADQFVIKNNEYLPRMWFVDRVRVIPDADTHLLAVADPSWVPREEALLFEDPGPVDPGQGGTAEITSYGLRTIQATLESPGNSFLVISEVHYQPGWFATLDGEPVDLHRANYVLKGIRVPPGKHELELRFEPPVFKRAIMVSVASNGLVLLGIVGSLVGRRRRRLVISG